MTQDDEQKEENDDKTADHSDNNDDGDVVNDVRHDYLDDINDDLEDLLDDDAHDDHNDVIDVNKPSDNSVQDDIFNDVDSTTEVQSDKSSKNSVKTATNYDADDIQETVRRDIFTPEMNKYDKRKDFFYVFWLPLYLFFHFLNKLLSN